MNKKFKAKANKLEQEQLEVKYDEKNNLNCPEDKSDASVILSCMIIQVSGVNVDVIFIWDTDITAVAF